MNFEALVPPYLHIIAAGQRTIARYAIKMAFEERSRAVRVLRGRKMQTRQSLFDEFSAALQFPYYFGENWDAFDECLADLEWLPAKNYLLLIMDATAALSQEDNEQIAIFADILSQVGTEWAHAKVPKSFHVLLQCASGDVPILQHRFRSASVEEL